MLVAFNKPFNVLCQFTDDARRRVDAGQGLAVRRRTLAEFGLPRDIYAAGRLDYDSEGLLLLTDHGKLAAQLTDPRHAIAKSYLVQVEGIADATQLAALRDGVLLKDGLTLPAQARSLTEPPAWLWPRDPPVRFRKTVHDCWIELVIREGRNRQVRRMTAAVGLPTLRLIRIAIGGIALAGVGLEKLAPGMWRAEASHSIVQRLLPPTRRP
ncbi:MAG TPA: pseudouridine synthase [Xanthomonadaceae bacterium]|jgi:23S rRNA pseudouridine2457 synthase|nr:pseudouridine synthase [Xanthomonadaceae bacterium]